MATLSVEQIQHHHTPPAAVDSGRRPSRLPFLTELLRARGRRRESYDVQKHQQQCCERIGLQALSFWTEQNISVILSLSLSLSLSLLPPSLLSSGTESPATPADGTGTLSRTLLMVGDLVKTSCSCTDNSIHGQPRMRRFRLTEDALEYYHHFFNQVCVCVCVCVCVYVHVCVHVCVHSGISSLVCHLHDSCLPSFAAIAIRISLPPPLLPPHSLSLSLSHPLILFHYRTLLLILSPSTSSSFSFSR